MHRFLGIVSVAAVALVGVISISVGPAAGSGGSVTGLSSNAVEGSSFWRQRGRVRGSRLLSHVQRTIPTTTARCRRALSPTTARARPVQRLSSRTYAEEGTYQTSVSVSGTDGFSGTGTGTATVSDARSA